ncbi:MAG: hypothetical protein LBV44_05800 [Methylobacillus sp.]|jgi:hypothetical protein|nr:hypothetical protein [Methylobacillus sp.]
MAKAILQQTDAQTEIPKPVTRHIDFGYIPANGKHLFSVNAGVDRSIAISDVLTLLNFARCTLDHMIEENPDSSYDIFGLQFILEQATALVKSLE